MLLGAKCSESNSRGVLSVLHPLSSFLPVPTCASAGGAGGQILLANRAPRGSVCRGAAGEGGASVGRDGEMQILPQALLLSPLSSCGCGDAPLQTPLQLSCTGREQLLSQVGPVAKTSLRGGDGRSCWGSSPETGMLHAGGGVRLALPRKVSP